jgi:nucleoid DNA-binding protein
MMKRPGILLAGVLGAACLTIGPAVPVEPRATAAPPPPAQRGEETFVGRVSKASGVSQEDVAKVLRALAGPLKDDLRQGKTVSLNGVGSFRIVKLPEYRDLKDGKPVIIPPRNSVEFQPAGDLADAANAEGTVPAATVPAFEYNALPGQTPGMRMDGVRMPNVRVK